MADYETRALSQVGISVLDCEHKTPTACMSGHPYIAIPDIVDGRVNLSSSRRISDASLIEWTRRTEPRRGDVLVTRRGRVGDTAPIPQDGCAIGQNLVLLRSDGKQVLQHFLTWATRSPQWWSEVDRLRNVGAVFSSLNVRDIARIRIPIPSLSEQRAIAEVLGALDDKIAANATLIRRADSLLHVTFESLLPDGESVPLSGLARFVNGKAFTKGATGKGRVVIRIAELNSGIGGSTVYNDIDVAEDHLARPGDLLFAWSGSLTVHRWFRPEGIVNQHIFKVIPTTAPMWVVKGALDRKIEDFRAIAADKATTMGHIQRRHLDELVSVPRNEAIQRFDGAMIGLWKRALAAEQESLRLAQMRDALLPALMSGRLRVKDAETIVEDVV